MLQNLTLRNLQDQPAIHELPRGYRQGHFEDRDSQLAAPPRASALQRHVSGRLASYRPEQTPISDFVYGNFRISRLKMCISGAGWCRNAMQAGTEEPVLVH